MTCKRVHAFLSEYLAGELPAATREAFLRHLEVCPSCRAYLDSFERTMAVAKAAERADAPAPPEELEAAILASLRRNR